MYVEGNSTAEATTDATPRKIAGPTFVQKIAEGLSVDEANNMITIDTAGDYYVMASICFSGSLSDTFNVTIYQDTTSSNLTLERKLGTGGDIGSANVSGIISCAADEDISLYHSSSDGGNAFTATDMQLSVFRLT